MLTAGFGGPSILSQFYTLIPWQCDCCGEREVTAVCTISINTFWWLQCAEDPLHMATFLPNYYGIWRMLRKGG